MKGTVITRIKGIMAKAGEPLEKCRKYVKSEKSSMAHYD